MNIISKELNKMRQIIDSNLELYMNIDNGYKDKIVQSMKYSLFSGGKRLRPIIAIKTFEIFNEDIEMILPYATAIEMIHTYSLIHDDLPSMDDDDYRRGKATSHKVFGEALAILTGDALLNYAFEVMSEDMLKKSNTLESYKNKARIIKEISGYSGVKGMIGGQVLDIASDSKDMDKDKLLFMYKAKTAALFQASVITGAILGGADDDEIELLREFSLCLGLSYQIKDDLLDKEEDQKIDKLTYLSYHSIEKSEKDLKEYSEKAIELLDQFRSKDIDFLKQLTYALINRKI